MTDLMAGPRPFNLPNEKIIRARRFSDLRKNFDCGIPPHIILFSKPRPSYTYPLMKRHWMGGSKTQIRTNKNSKEHRLRQFFHRPKKHTSASAALLSLEDQLEQCRSASSIQEMAAILPSKDLMALALPFTTHPSSRPTAPFSRLRIPEPPETVMASTCEEDPDHHIGMTYDTLGSSSFASTKASSSVVHELNRDETPSPFDPHEYVPCNARPHRSVSPSRGLIQPVPLRHTPHQFSPHSRTSTTLSPLFQTGYTQENFDYEGQ
jgi:hypothetical protein